MGGKLLILNLLPFKVSWGMSFTFSETLPESEIGLHKAKLLILLFPSSFKKLRVD